MQLRLDKLETEQRNQNTKDIDRISTLEMVLKINQEDHKIADAVQQESKMIAQLIDAASDRLLKGGRLIYVGAGTSGRLGVLDASECPPTYGVSPEKVQGLIAGGQAAMFRSQEGAEDHPLYGETDLKSLNVTENDVVVGLAASGRTPYVLGALHYANEVGALTGSVSCVSHAKISELAQYPIEVIVGPEVVTGSTRMKAGTAQKMVLNMISTGCMIRYGKVYQNLMVDVQPTNEKLIERAKRIIQEAVGIEADKANELFEQSGHDVKLAIIMGVKKISKQQAQQELDQAQGHVSKTIYEGGN